jgi:hypothetical protein
MRSAGQRNPIRSSVEGGGGRGEGRGEENAGEIIKGNVTRLNARVRAEEGRERAPDRFTIRLILYGKGACNV